mgnify:CR=1 FL=1
MNNLSSLPLNLKLEITQRGRQVVQQNLGQIRALASLTKQQNPQIDEENFFRLCTEAYFKGIKTELCKIFDSEYTNNLLNIYGVTKKP